MPDKHMLSVYYVLLFSHETAMETLVHFNKPVITHILGHRSYTIFSRDFYETILVGKFPSRDISEKCIGRRSK